MAARDSSSLAGSVVMDAKTPMMLQRTFKPEFRVEFHRKDWKNALNAAHEVGCPVPLTGQMMENFQAYQKSRINFVGLF